MGRGLSNLGNGCGHSAVVYGLEVLGALGVLTQSGCDSVVRRVVWSVSLSDAPTHNGRDPLEGPPRCCGSGIPNRNQACHYSLGGDVVDRFVADSWEHVVGEGRPPLILGSASWLPLGPVKLNDLLRSLLEGRNLRPRSGGVASRPSNPEIFQRLGSGFFERDRRRRSQGQSPVVFLVRFLSTPTVCLR